MYQNQASQIINSQEESQSINFNKQTFQSNNKNKNTAAIKDFDCKNENESNTNINERFQSKVGIKRLLTFN